MTDERKQHPEEESFKDKILNSLHGAYEQSPEEPDDYEENDFSRFSTEINTQDNGEQPIEEQDSVGSRSQRNNLRAPEEDAFVPYDRKEEDIYPVDTKVRRRQQRKKEDKIVNKIVLIIVLVLLFVGGILGFSAYRYVSSSLKPLNAKNEQLVQVEIPSGSSNKEIGDVLEKSKIIKSGLVFNYYTKFKNYTGFQAGFYQMAPNMTLDEIGKLLEEGGSPTPVDVADKRLTIPEGYDVEQVAKKVAKVTEYSEKEFLALMEDEAFFTKLKEQYPQLLEGAAKAEGVRYRLEGYLYPATYDYYNSNTLEDIVTQMVDKSNTVLTPYLEQIQQKNMTLHEVLTIASLVEKEGVKEGDRKNIAQVFANRVAVDMPLQSDISILYALGEHKELVTYEDTAVDSPYNLYLNTGYGPGPFDNPSEEAIQAVLNPTENDYYYFVADIDTGKVYFAKTYEEHMEYVEEYVNK
ncbi:aminodeoxychorismate lyase [Enterococcus sp. JM4C]|uniref:endolytic transglycosylase MltG n=1 Tax=Candidatus Enterococcus huntleyi TaxID=1857217 RepID=UPI00137A897A|nr:aminodeoxychorismate lyase [Enterococcus sp. JM4C]